MVLARIGRIHHLLYHPYSWKHTTGGWAPRFSHVEYIFYVGILLDSHPLYLKQTRQLGQMLIPVMCWLQVWQMKLLQKYSCCRIINESKSLSSGYIRLLGDAYTTHMWTRSIGWFYNPVENSLEHFVVHRRTHVGSNSNSSDCPEFLSHFAPPSLFSTPWRNAVQYLSVPGSSAGAVSCTGFASCGVLSAPPVVEAADEDG